MLVASRWMTAPPSAALLGPADGAAPAGPAAAAPAAAGSATAAVEPTMLAAAGESDPGGDAEARPRDARLPRRLRSACARFSAALHSC